MQLRVDDDLGSLTVGKIADFQILDKDIFEVPADEIYKVYPKAVFMDGQLVAGSLAGAE
ncbi:amidohydrolase family protein [Sulfitobacter pacificus]